MAKFYGTIGYVEMIEGELGVYVEHSTERSYSGDLIKNYSRYEPSGGVNDNLTVSNKISVIADPYASEHFYAIRYVKFQIPKLGGIWEVTGAEVQYPRIVLTLGGVYNGDTAGTAD